MSSKCIKRLQQELKDLKANKSANADAMPDESDLLTWYMILDGPASTPYEGGEYLGRIKIPQNYPFSPPSYFFCTPNGRFQTETSICTSFSSFHSDQWSPAWNISTILQGLLSFMVENANTAGSITTDDATKKSLAQASHQFNVKQRMYKTLFPERYEKALEKVEKEKKEKEEAQKKIRDDDANSNNNNSKTDNVKPTTGENNGTGTNNNFNNNNNNNNLGFFSEAKTVGYVVLGVALGVATVVKFLS